MEDGTCEGCFYALPTVTDDDDIIMKCRRYPPVVFVDADGEMAQSNPDAVSKCGEFRLEEGAT